MTFKIPLSTNVGQECVAYQSGNPSILESYAGLYLQVYQSDPVETKKLTDYIRERLQLAQQIYGAEFETRFLQDADPAVVDQLWKELAS